jgi:arachidonate 15-lipoxygenase
MATTNPSLPQTDSPAEQQARAAQLQAAQQTYTYTYDTSLQPLAVATTVPKADGPALIWAGSAVILTLDLLGNVLAKASKIFGPGAKKPTIPRESPEDLAKAIETVVELRDLHEDLAKTLTDLHANPVKAAAQEASHSPAKGLLGFAEGLVARVEAAIEGESPAEKALRLIGEIGKKLLTDFGQKLLAYLEFYGEASNIGVYAEQFQTMRVPEIESAWDDDRMFAWLRIAGPNPGLIKGISALPGSFPVSEAQYRETMGANDSLAAAGKEGRLFLLDYAALATVQTGTFPDQQKYLAVPLALFAIAPQGAADRSLRAVAIQLGQAPDNDTPVITPSSPAWSIAKIWVQIADGNYHEMVAHLAETHLVIEAFAVATPRNLATSHPLYLLLEPHAKGTLFINNLALKALINTNGVVDALLAGTIGSSIQLAVDRVVGYSLHESFLPEAIQRRSVETLPVYPFRDDAMMIWGAIHQWVQSYLGIYYRNDEDVQQDYELQAWVRDLGGKNGARLGGVGEPGIPGEPAIRTFRYLVNVATMAIYTGSAQHAAVNFTQNFIMKYTPAVPLAGYLPPPGSADEQGNLLGTLPPLQKSLLQQALLTLLGGVYYTKLGDYDRNVPGHYFQDARVAEPLATFQASLAKIESDIGRKNLSRIPYIVLLPSEIPQSINI